jgi:hypothetical protein
MFGCSNIDSDDSTPKRLRIALPICLEVEQVVPLSAWDSSGLPLELPCSITCGPLGFRDLQVSDR